MDSYYYFFPPYPKSGNSVFQFKISLKYPKPLIWRRVLVPGDYTFRDLHFVIQNVMGWSSTHMYKFDLKDHLTGEEIEVGGCGEFGDDVDFKNWITERTKLRTYFKNENDKATYDYDFGSTWHHNILLEKILPTDPLEMYPQCIAGRRATPPEHDTPEETEGFDPERFDKNQITFVKCLDHFKDMKIGQSCKGSSSDESESDSSNFSSDKLSKEDFLADKRSVKKKSRHTSSEVLATNRTKLVEQAIDNCQKVHAEGINVASEVTEDAEDHYGKFIASRLRDIKDLEKREDLRSAIQQLINKYTFKN